MIAVKHILRYVQETIAYGLRYTSSGGVLLYRFRLDGQCSGPEEYFQILIQFGFSYDFLVQQETGLCSPKHCIGIIHCC